MKTEPVLQLPVVIAVKASVASESTARDRDMRLQPKSRGQLHNSMHKELLQPAVTVRASPPLWRGDSGASAPGGTERTGPRAASAAQRCASYRLPLSFPPAVPGGTVRDPAALARGRSGALGTTGLERAASVSELAGHVPLLDAVSTGRRALHAGQVRGLGHL